MEWNITLRRTQSLKSVSDSNDKSVWKDIDLPNKNMSVSDLVARYQSAVSGKTIIQATPAYHSKTKQVQVLQEETAPAQKAPPKSILKKTEEKSQVKSNLTPAKSMDSLQSNTVSIMSLRALYEAKATTTDKEKSSLRAANSSPHMRDVPVMNGDTQDAAITATNKSSLKAVQNVPQIETKQEHVTKKAVNLDRVERRRTIGGIDFERNVAADADEKRRSIADFRDIQTKDKPSVSVKVMSALYLSKVATQKSTNTPVTPEHNRSSESVKRGKSFQMAEDPTSFQGKGGLPPPPSGAEDRSGVHYQGSQVSKEMLYQQRQKCELRRLLKHTHPELKMLDDVVDEELAEVLSSEKETAGETGYEGEVFSRCLIFENSGLKDKVSPITPKMHMVEGTAEKCDVKKLSAIFKEPKEKSHTGTVKALAEDDKSLVFRPEPDGDHEEEEDVKIDVQATRRLFESQHVNTGRSNSDRIVQTHSSVSADETNPQIQNMEIDMRRKPNSQIKNKRIYPDLEKQPDKQASSVYAVVQNSESEIPSSKATSTAEIEEEFSSSPDAEGGLAVIKTSASLFQNNPFISTNIERENSYVHTSKPQISARDGTGENCLVANVRNRTHLFESISFDKIRQQNKDEIETMVENIKETLDILYNARAIHSLGSIIEVNETMIAKKAKFTMSQSGPEIKYDEVAEGGAQNFVLHSLPRVNLKPQITYLKEDNKGRMKATVVNVPVHQRPVHTTKDTECKTANVAQLVEDILNQDNSLRKGVIIQQDENNSAEVIVYSLHKYFDEEDVKTYSPAQGAEYYEPEPENDENGKTLDKETRKGIIDSAKRSFLDTFQDQTCPGFLRPEVTEKGNVKLFRSCIEKGDFDYLKTLHTEATAEEQEPPQNEPVTRQEPYEQKGDLAEESTSEWVPVDIKRLKSIFSGNQNEIQPKPNVYDTCLQSTLMSTTGQNVLIDQKQYVQNSCKSVVNTQNQANNSKVTPPSSFLSSDGQDDDRVLQAELVQVIDENDEMSDLQTAIQELQQATIKAKALYHPSGVKGKVLLQEPSQEDSVSIVHSSETMPTQEEEVDFQGKVQAALDSLEKSNINVTKGDFRAAMIYRNSSKPCQERPQNINVPSVNDPTEMFCPNTPQEPLVKEVSATNAKAPQEANPPNKQARGAMSDKNKRPLGTKPAIPPKPEHLMMKQGNDQSSDPKYIQATQNNKVTPNEMFQKSPHKMAKTTVPCQDELGQDPLKSNRDSSDTQNTELSSKSEQMNRDPDILCFAVPDTKVITKQQTINVKADEKIHKDSSVKEGLSENEEKHMDFHEACQKFGGKKASPKKIAPVKPKRVKIAQPAHVSIDQSCHAGGHSDDSKGKQEKAMMPENRVEMREKKGRTETEDERRQRLSVHMDEIMRGNITAAMEIFDNLRKQEELQSLLSRVEEIEQDTSEVDVKSLKSVFENVPDWVVSANKSEQVEVKEENKVKRLPPIKENTQTKTSMALVFGDLERASEEIMNLKEQTLARLVDIEGTIKKALYSVSTLKSDADIAGLSCLFKESLGAVQGSPSSGNISKISIESSRKKSQQANEKAKNTTEPSAETKQRSSPPSSPAFISIESAARKTDRAEAAVPETLICKTCQQSPKVEEKFRTTKTLTCNSPAGKRKGEPRGKGQKQAECSQLSPNREVSVLEVHTDHQGKSIVGTKTVTENYERTDNFGNRFYSSKTSTVVTPQPETTKSPTSPAALSPGTYQVTTYPEVQLPVNQMPHVSNYTPANGEFYCIFHYKQLFRRKGNYDEGFGHEQHKSRWLMRSTFNQHEEHDA